MDRSMRVIVGWTHPETEEDLLVRAEVLPGNEGRTYGPPEKCFPPEAPEVFEFEVYEDLGKGKRGRRRTDVEGWLACHRPARELLEEQLVIEAGEREQAAREDAEEARAEARREEGYTW
jgi:hypothetical protein